MAENKKTVNPLLIAVIGLTVYALCAMFVTAFESRISCEISLVLSIFALINEVLLAAMLAVVMILSSLGKPTKLIHYFVAMGMEALVILIRLPALITKLFYSDPWIINWLFKWANGSIIFALIGALAAIPVSMWMKDKDLKMQLLIFATVCVVTIVISCVLMFGLPITKHQIAGGTLGFTQSFVIFPFVAALSNAPIKMYVEKTAGERPMNVKASAYSYLEQYKQNRKNGGNKNV